MDENMPADKELSTKDIEEILSLRKEHMKLSKAIKNARIAMGVICGFSIIVLILMATRQPDTIVLSVSIALIFIFGICAAIEPQYSKYSISVALGLYILNLIASFFNNPLFAFFGLFIRAIFIYYLVLGLMAALKYNPILTKMRRLNIRF